MKLIIAGVGPGDPDLITLKAVNEAADADMILVPYTGNNNQGIAEKIILTHIPDARISRILFPMIHDADRRDEIILAQLLSLESELRHSEKIFFPVIGDSLLFSTGAYLIDAMRKIFQALEIKFIPGISAHSLAASYAQKFLAISDEIFTIISGTAAPEKILHALKNSNAAAIYKPNVLKNLRRIVNESGTYRKILRVDFAGITDKEQIIEGEKALENIDEYLSIILLWKD